MTTLTKMNPFTFGTDNGPACPLCSGHVYGYREDPTDFYGARANAHCFGCKRIVSFRTPVRFEIIEDVRVIREAHESADRTNAVTVRRAGVKPRAG